MRTEEAIRNYLTTCLSFIKRNPSMKFYEAAVSTSAAQSPRPSSSPMLERAHPEQQASPVTADAREANEQNPAHPQNALEDQNIIDHVLIVRKLTELHELVKKRREVLHELESAHVILAREVMRAVAAHVRSQSGKLTWRERLRQPLSPHKSTQASRKRLENLDTLTETFGSFLPACSFESELWLARNPEKRTLLPSRTIWEALADTPQELLDAYQPVTKLKVFRGQIAPSIDLYLTKLNLLTVRVQLILQRLTDSC